MWVRMWVRPGLTATARTFDSRLSPGSRGAAWRPGAGLAVERSHSVVVERETAPAGGTLRWPDDEPAADREHLSADSHRRPIQVDRLPGQAHGLPAPQTTDRDEVQQRVQRIAAGSDQESGGLRRCPDRHRRAGYPPRARPRLGPRSRPSDAVSGGEGAQPDGPGCSRPSPPGPLRSRLSAASPAPGQRRRRQRTAGPVCQRRHRASVRRICTVDSSASGIRASPGGR
jgi:hypothetical protein